MLCFALLKSGSLIIVFVLCLPVVIPEAAAFLQSRVHFCHCCVNDPARRVSVLAWLTDEQTNNHVCSFTIK